MFSDSKGFPYGSPRGPILPHKTRNTGAPSKTQLYNGTKNHDGMMAPINNKNTLNMMKQGAFYLGINSESAIKKPSSAEHT